MMTTRAARFTPTTPRRRLLAALALPLATALAVVPAAAQDGTSIFTLLDVSDRQIAAGDEVAGELTATDYIASGRRVQAWALEAAPGEALQLDLVSEDFDPLLYVAGPGVGELSDDDGGDGTNSRLCIEFPDGGLYRIVAGSYSGDTGRYRVMTARRSNCSEPGARTSDVTDLSSLDAAGRVLPRRGEVQGELTAADPTMFGSPVQAWAMEGAAGESVTVDLLSGAFDAYLTVVGPGLDSWLTNDDGAGGCNSRVTLQFPQSATYQVIASSVSGNTGAFTLATSAEPRPPAEEGCVPPRRNAATQAPVSDAGTLTPAGSIEAGSTVTGTLSGSAVTFQSRPAQRWTLEGRQGQQLAIEHVSDDFDAFLYLQGPGFESAIYNDDDGDGLNSRLCVTLPATGSYDVLAAALRSGAAGSYRLSVIDSPGGERCSGFRFSVSLGLGALPLESRRLDVGDEVAGELDPAADQRHPGDGSLVDVWAVEAEAGQRIVVDLISDDFDAYLYLLGPGLESPQTDDDSGGRCHSRIEVVAPVAGTYRAVANSLREGGSGSYTLRVSPAAGPVLEGACGGSGATAPAVSSLERSAFTRVISISRRTLPMGAEVVGDLSDGDPLLDDGSHGQAWSLHVEAGESVIVELVSTDFDAFLYVVPPRGAVMEDDDGLSGTDSRLTFTADATGTYHVVVNSFGEGATGRYRLRSLRRVESDR